MPVDELIKQLEAAVLAAASKATEAADQSRLADTKNWSEATHTLAEALSLVKLAYKS